MAGILRSIYATFKIVMGINSLKWRVKSQSKFIYDIGFNIAKIKHRFDIDKIVYSSIN
ncbi:hypothetical protein GCM10010832_26360 [Psychroflexus planctonicus]|uniref:Transposase DDE domain-containing protein n=1 Tax=Psychroflexus planctonicus TaxID=1526575 RepID=A0ABQ1SND0_9FLAO|nr:hypothetical protein GCM10010832_26360 [Psychroflexus planctonicus]